MVPWRDDRGAASSSDDSEPVRVGGIDAEADSRILVVSGGNNVEDEGSTIMPGGIKVGNDGGASLVVTGFRDSVVATVATASYLLLLVFGRTVGPPMRVEVRYCPNSSDMLVRGHSVCSHCSLNLSMSPTNINNEFDI